MMGSAPNLSFYCRVIVLTYISKTA